jgi:ATP-dependent protease ClpP protease subunit
MNKENYLDPKLFGQDKYSNSFSKPVAQLHEFYLSGPVLDAEEYIDWFDTIRNASAVDTIRIYINSPGGDLYTTLQFLRVMSDTEATVVTSVEGACMSAATMIFLHGHMQEVTPHSLFMFHNYSAGTFGKGGEMYDQLQFERKWSENFMREVYADFLTEDEIQSMLHNKDIWMDSEEVVKRLTALQKQRDKDARAESKAKAAQRLKQKNKQWVVMQRGWSCDWP